ncbi:MAG: hypothetical protein ACI3Y5_00590 [Prevotella sp.]
MNNTGNISIEKFAAFLDGNLPEDEMLSIETAIDGNAEYSDILSEVMSVDDSVSTMLPQADYQAEPFADMDIVLPVIPLPAVTDDVEIELSVTDPSASLHVAAAAADCPVMSITADDSGEEPSPTPFDINPDDTSGGMEETGAIDDNPFIDF